MSAHDPVHHIMVYSAVHALVLIFSLTACMTDRHGQSLGPPNQVRGLTGKILAGGPRVQTSLRLGSTQVDFVDRPLPTPSPPVLSTPESGSDDPLER